MRPDGFHVGLLLLEEVGAPQVSGATASTHETPLPAGVAAVKVKLLHGHPESRQVGLLYVGQAASPSPSAAASAMAQGMCAHDVRGIWLWHVRLGKTVSVELLAFGKGEAALGKGEAGLETSWKRGGGPWLFLEKGRRGRMIRWRRRGGNVAHRVAFGKGEATLGKGEASHQFFLEKGRQFLEKGRRASPFPRGCLPFSKKKM